MTNEFSQLGLDPEMVETITQLGYEHPTPVQTSVIPMMLAGQDVVAQSKTGTGKTAAFALPMIQTLDPSRKKIQGLIIAPTRELAMQVSNAVFQYGQGKGRTGGGDLWRAVLQTADPTDHTGRGYRYRDARPIAGSDQAKET